MTTPYRTHRQKLADAWNEFTVCNNAACLAVTAHNAAVFAGRPSTDLAIRCGAAEGAREASLAAYMNEVDRYMARKQVRKEL